MSTLGEDCDCADPVVAAGLAVVGVLDDGGLAACWEAQMMSDGDDGVSETAAEVAGVRPEG